MRFTCDLRIIVSEDSPLPSRSQSISASTPHLVEAATLDEAIDVAESLWSVKISERSRPMPVVEPAPWVEVRPHAGARREIAVSSSSLRIGKHRTGSSEPVDLEAIVTTPPSSWGELIDRMSVADIVALAREVLSTRETKA